MSEKKPEKNVILRISCKNVSIKQKLTNLYYFSQNYYNFFIIKNIQQYIH